MQLEGRKKQKQKCGLCQVWDLILKFFFYNRLLVWIEFKFILNYCYIMQLEEKKIAKAKSELCGI